MGKLVQPIPIELDRPRRLACDFNAFVAVQQWTGENIFGLANPLADQIDRPVKGGQNGEVETVTLPDPIKIRAMLAALLLHEDQSMTPVAAGRLITFENINVVITKCSEAINAYVGEATDGANPTGAADQATNLQPLTSSGPSADTTSDSATPSSGA